MFALIFSLLFNEYLLKVLVYYYVLVILIFVYKKATTVPVYDKSGALKQKTLMIVLGSGGHTTEMLLMLTRKNTHQFEFNKYKEVHFVIGHSDTWSWTKIKDFLYNGGKGIDIEKQVPNLHI